MNDATPLLLGDFPRAILHIDGDAFFTSVEQALDPALKDRPLATGKERGIIACASYEAKARGVARGVPLHIAREMCPGLIVVPSDYESYSLFSRRMFNIMRTYTPVVEEYSIDEAFADITGMRRVFRCSYEDIALRLQAEILKELDITVSVGLSLTKSLAKLGSKFRKPRGFTAVAGRHIHLLLQRTPLDKVWGFGPNTVSLLAKQGLQTAWDFVRRPEAWADRLLHKPGREIWNELRGTSVWPVSTEPKTDYATIIKSKTFAPPSGDREQVFARLVHNVEAAFMKARRHHLRPRMLAVVLRHQDFRHDGIEARLSRPTSSTQEALPLIRGLFEQIHRPDAVYRSTLIVLGNLEADRSRQMELFADNAAIESLRVLAGATDEINALYGRFTLGSGACLNLAAKPDHPRDEPPPRTQRLLKGESAKRRLAFPRLNVRV